MGINIQVTYLIKNWKLFSKFQEKSNINKLNKEQVVRDFVA